MDQQKSQEKVVFLVLIPSLIPPNGCQMFNHTESRGEPTPEAGLWLQGGVLKQRRYVWFWNQLKAWRRPYPVALRCPRGGGGRKAVGCWDEGRYENPRSGQESGVTDASPCLGAALLSPWARVLESLPPKYYLLIRGGSKNLGSFCSADCCLQIVCHLFSHPDPRSWFPGALGGEGTGGLVWADLSETPAQRPVGQRPRTGPTPHPLRNGAVLTSTGSALPRLFSDPAAFL